MRSIPWDRFYNDRIGSIVRLRSAPTEVRCSPGSCSPRFVAELNGQPTGFFQYYRVAADLVGTDQFLADEVLLSQGLGTATLLAFIELIVRNEQLESFLVDPHPDNARAIRCYEKCGFVYDPRRSSASTYVMTRN